MSSSQNRDVQRRSWDVEAYERRAANREQAEVEAERERLRARKASRQAEHQDGDPFAPTRAWLRKRDHVIDFSHKVGSVEIVGSSVAGGFECRVCDVTLKDSNRFLVHINSRAHQKTLGMSMRVKRSSVEEIEQAFENALRTRDAKQEQKGRSLKHGAGAPPLP